MSEKKKIGLIINAQTTEINDQFIKVLNDWEANTLPDVKYSNIDYLPIIFSCDNTEQSIFQCLENAYTNNKVKYFIGNIAVEYLFDSAVEWFQDHQDALWVTTVKPYNTLSSPNVKCVQINEENYMKAFEVLQMKGVYQNHVPVISAYQGATTKNTNPEYVEFYKNIIETNVPNTIFSIDSFGNNQIEENIDAIKQAVGSNTKQDTFAFRFYNPYMKKLSEDFLPFDLVASVHIDPKTRDIVYSLAVDSLIVLLELINHPDKTIIQSSTGEIQFDQTGCRKKQIIFFCYKNTQNSVLPDQDYWTVRYQILYENGVFTPMFEQATTSSVNMVNSINKALNSKFDSIISLESKINSINKY